MLLDERDWFEKEGIEYISTIAEGAYGKIFLVYSKKLQANFALKKIPEKDFSESEVELMKELSHPNVIKMIQIYRFSSYVYLLMEYCPFDLHKFLEKHEQVNPDQLNRLCHDILISIKALHDQNIAHSDIKPSNFLLDKSGHVKVCDFGFSSKYDVNSESQTHHGTLFFMAPEIFKKQKYNPLKADIWAIGVTFYYMATHSFPFFSTNILQFIKIVNNGLYPQYKIPNIALQMVISRCLEINPDNRPTIDELLRMPYFEIYRSQRSFKSELLQNTQSQNAIIVKPVLTRYHQIGSEHVSVVTYQKKRSVSNAFDVKKMISGK
ncbi:CAMK family protein kinase [Trichomonas vaginalis G3]|uniref:CAMK family protein kinase n=1 Tax=Trichomonas vaginalis (strain ATCC PRA-98 / G3) TaxID=412133 RepID=A2F5L1_TRIV3|nr:protein serine/threonine kinase protein [Trichomonas vaginalis G3]EAX99774.1 CAMK family protein kinase [Trichomonas vaginalis G3]KAI5494408.1 protein serine/threonine kinase protein [Trichomonas vaginalis G3]|eukprot:XP_001312704.1 CAMK family protein kinase [Trichomonas vaginalis G3]